MAADTELAHRLKDYWLNGNRSRDNAVGVVGAALATPPSSAVIASRALQVMDQIEVNAAWQPQVEEFRAYVEHLVTRRHEVDALGDPDTPPVKVLEYIGDATAQLNLPQFDPTRLQSARIKADNRAAGERAP